MATISVTERGLFKRCRRRWDLSSFNRQSLSPIINAAALDLGTLIHSTLEKWTEDPALDPLEVYNFIAEELKTKIILDYNERIGCLPSTDELSGTFNAIAMGRVMIANYKAHWRTPLPAGYTLIQNEQTLTIPIPNTEHCKFNGDNECDMCACNECSDSWEQYYKCTDVIDFTPSSFAYRCPCCVEPHYLEATFDGIMADELGQLFIIERKTYNRKPSEDDLDENDQFLAYMWALQTAMPDASIRGVSYDGLWKRDHIPSGKQLSDMFLRKILMRNRQELDEFGSFLDLEVMDMTDPNVRIYKNVPAVGGCWDCNFRPLCKSMSRNPQHHTDMILKQYAVSNHKRWKALEDE